VKYQIIVRPAADSDIEEAALWYERQRSGLGREFLAGVDDTFERLKESPDPGIPAHKSLRRASVSRFPYGVFYQVVKRKIIVVGVFHGRRAPRKWKSRAE
jgi:toxin ParE1/3/4